MISKLLPNAVIRRVFHIRGLGDKNTGVEMRWKDVVGSNFDPDWDQSPITKGFRGPGDGTVPGWSARLAQTPESQICSFKKVKKHGSIMENKDVLRVISSIIETGKVPKRVREMGKSFAPPLASPKVVREFLVDVASGTVKIEDPRVSNEKIWGRIVEDGSLA